MRAAVGLLFPLILLAEAVAAQGPRLLPRDHPAAIRHRLAAVADPAAGSGIATPYRDIDPAPAPLFGVELRVGADVAVGERHFDADRGSPPFAAVTLPNRVEAGGSARLWFRPTESLELTGRLAGVPHDPHIDELHLAAVFGPLYGWIGRRAVGYGAGHSASVIHAGRVPLDGVGMGVRDPFRLPGALAGLGRWDFELFVARGADNGPIGHPWIAGARGTLQPTPWLLVGVTRGAQFLGDGAPGLTWRRFASLLLGTHVMEDGRRVNTSNQLVSVDVAIRGTIDRVPFLATLEIGAEDSSGAFRDSPSIVAGFEVVHPRKALSIGVVHTSLHPENGHGYFYRHSVYTAGWSDRGRGLGHPLGGPGREWQLHLTSVDPRQRWDLDAGLFTRERFAGTSLGDDLVGHAIGGRLHARVALGSLDLFALLEGERHEHGIERLTGSIGLRWTRGPLR